MGSALDSKGKPSRVDSLSRNLSWTSLAFQNPQSLSETVSANFFFLFRQGVAYQNAFFLILT